MNKSDLIEALAKKEDLKDKEAVEIVNMVFKGRKARPGQFSNSTSLRTNAF